MAEQDAERIDTAILRDALAEAVAAGQAKDDFLSMLSHELRNPLNAISTAAQVLQRADGNSPEAASARNIVMRQARALTTIVDGLLDTGQVIAGQADLQCQPFDLAPLVERAVVACRHEAEAKGQDVQAVLDTVWVHADVKRIAQVIERLLGLAVKHTPGGGRIAVELIDQQGAALLRVRQSGNAINPQMLGRIFEPRQARGPEQRDGGLGIGLTLIRRLVEMHGGTAQARGEATQTVFEITLPSHEAARDAAPS